MITMAAVTSFGDIPLWIIVVHCFYMVSCQSEVQVYVGDNVLLPCIYSGLPPPKVTISWRDKDDSTVLDIENSDPNYSSQSPKFKGRVYSFPELFPKGNFSIHLQNVQQDDAGAYECHIRVGDGSLQRIRLTVTGERAVVKATPPPSHDNSAGTSASVQLLLLLLLVLVRLN